MAEEEKEEKQSLYEHHRIVTDPKQSPIRLDKFLMDRLERTSRNRVQQAIRAGAILVDGEEVKPNHVVKPGETITVSLPRPRVENDNVEAEAIPLDVRYEDDQFLIVHKPAGLVVHPGVGVHRGTLVNALAWYYRESEHPLPDVNLAARPALSHRIDKDTSGLLVVPKTEHAQTHLGKQFFDHTIERRYIALIWGEPENDEGTITGHIGRDPRFRTKMTVFPEGETGKEATTHYKVLERLYYVTLVECRLETGRTHQIRVHMSYAGHPLFNDDRYGGDRINKGTIHSKYKRFVENNFDILPRQALHAKSLGFVHPTTEEKVFFDSELPDDFQEVLQRWRTYLAGRRT